MTEDAAPSTRSRPLTPFRAAHGVVKTLSILVGLPLTVFCLMSVVGLATGNFWVRLVPALVVALGAPLFLVDRLLPEGELARARGLPTDVLALCWLGFAVLFAGVAQPVTRPALLAEADRYGANGDAVIAKVGYWVGGATPVAPAARVEEPRGRRRAPGGAGDAGAGATGDANGDAAASRRDGAGEIAPTDAAAPDGGSKAASRAANPADAAPHDGGQATFTAAELFAKLSPAIVTISVQNESGEQGSGTGFFIDRSGTIATNQHVVGNAKSVGVKLIGDQYQGGHRWLHEVELLVEDADVDLALLRVPPQRDIAPLPLGDSDEIHVGDQLVCIGNPLGLEHTLSDGLVSARRVHNGRRWVQMTAPISPGNSGGPVIAMNGRVVGIATATINRLFETAQNLNLAVPVNALKAMIRDDYPARRRLDTAPGGPSSW